MSYLENSRGEIDLVRPGEQWFFYWKTSAALWESRIVQFPKEQTIFIPVFWGHHADSPTSWDFRNNTPDRDLGRLVTLLVQNKRKFCWLLPLTPAPFLPNGGVPVSAARTLSISSDGVHLAVFDQERKLHKIFSYFEPKVFGAFSSFLNSFKNFLSRLETVAPVWGCDFSYYSEGQNHSYLKDHSIAFEQGFSRYLKNNHAEEIEHFKPNEEARLKASYTEDVQELFKTTARDILGTYWKGVQSIVALGGSPKDTIERSLSSGKSQLTYIDELLGHYVQNRWITSCLLTPVEKKDLLLKVLEEHFGAEEISQRYEFETYKGELGQEFRPFSLVDMMDGKSRSHFNQLGLISYLQSHYQWMYHVQDEINFTQDWVLANHHKLKFFNGASLNRTRFNQMIKLFLMGQRVILDLKGIPAELEKRLHVFYMENNLKTQSINFITNVNLCELGDGRFITIDSEKLNPSNQDQFWNQLFRYFKLNHPEVIMEPDVFCFWRIRATSPMELNYLDVRRINLYNPTSYRKLVTIHTHRQFAFMKMIDPTKANAKTISDGVEIELLPNGKVALDFGHYEDN